MTKDSPQTSEEFSWLQFRIDLETICHVVEIVIGIYTILTWLQPYIQEIRELDTDMIVPFEQLVERVTKTLEEPNPTDEIQKNSGNP